MKTVKLLVVKLKIEFDNGKIRNYFFDRDITLKEAFEKNPVLKHGIIISVEVEDCEVIPYGKSGKKFQVAYTNLIVDENGKIIGYNFEQNPNFDELMAISLKDIAEAEGDENAVNIYELLEKGE
ncbi:MAG: hypothetical protein ACK4K9_10030 [Bacteroidia bacterium]